MGISVSMTVNGKAVTREVETRTLLSQSKCDPQQKHRNEKLNTSYRVKDYKIRSLGSQK